ncbi:hypothetical protein GALL_418570 [mine drainage metagenome]|uniref:Uncharacterized protein n=1 Tax=mine drainage metagenome TaxID=410659 RepID=A0A1J5QG21_9ZZZZ
MHIAAGKAVRQLGALRVNLHPHGKAGARHAFVQGTQIARQAVRQHRHHAVREIAGVAAPPRLAVKRRPRRDVMRDIGDRDPEDMAALVLGVVIGMRMDRIVMVARVRRVDRDQRQAAQILAVAQARGVHRVRLGDHVVGEIVGDAVLVDGNKRDRARGRRVAQHLDHAGLWQTHAGAIADLLCLYQLAILGVMGGFGGDAPFLVLALVDRHDAPAFGFLAENADDLVRVGTDLADQPRLVMMVLPGHRIDAGEDAVALGHRRIGLARHEEDARRGAGALPFQRLGKLITMGVRRKDLQHRNWRQRFRVAVAPVPLFQRALGLQLFQQTLEVDARGPLDTKSPRDVALGGGARMICDPGEKFGFAGYLAHASALPRPVKGVIGEKAWRALGAPSLR